MKLRSCDACGQSLASDGKDVFFAVKIQIQKGTPWGSEERARAERLVTSIRQGGDLRLADHLDNLEPVEFVGDHLPSLVTHADLRICADCVLKARVLNLTEIVKAVETGTPRVAPS